jgi:hypothetical protein
VLISECKCCLFHHKTRLHKEGKFMVMMTVKCFTNYFNSFIYLRVQPVIQNQLHIEEFASLNLVRVIAVCIFSHFFQTNFNIVPRITLKFFQTRAL